MPLKPRDYSDVEMKTVKQYDKYCKIKNYMKTFKLEYIITNLYLGRKKLCDMDILKKG